MIAQLARPRAAPAARLARRQWRGRPQQQEQASFLTLLPRGGSAVEPLGASISSTSILRIECGSSISCGRSKSRFPLKGAAMALASIRPKSSAAMRVYEEMETEPMAMATAAASDDLVSFKLTDIGEGIMEVELLQWFVQPGDNVKQFDRVCEVQSDKATVEISSRYDGVVEQLHYETGEMVKTGAALMDIRQSSAAPTEILATASRHAPLLSVPPAPAQPPKPSFEAAETAAETAAVTAAVTAETALILTTPAVRRLAREFGVDLSAVAPTGPKNRLLKADVLRHINSTVPGVCSSSLSSAAEAGAAATGAVQAPPTLQFPAQNSLPQQQPWQNNVQQQPQQQPALVPKHRASLIMEESAPAAAAAPRAAAAVAPRLPVAAAAPPVAAASAAQPAAAAAAGPAAAAKAAEIPSSVPEPTMISGRWSETHVPTPGQTVPIRGIQRSMLETMRRSLEVPHMVFCDEVIMDKAVALREDLKKAAAAQGVKLTHLPMLIKATSLALKRFPLLNSSLSPCQTAITYHAAHNIGVAMDTPRGLLVPNVKNVQDRSVFDVARELNRLQAVGAEGRFSSEDLAGGTFTLSNIGSIGGTYACPVILHPQVAIGALGKMKRVPRFDDDGNVVPQTLLLVSWSADHRIIDGGTMARFSNLWKSYLENPAAMLGEAR